MNYEELQIANDLLKEIKNINDLLQVMKECSNYIRISTSYRFDGMDVDCNVYFVGNHKDKILEVIKGIKDEMLKELNELGVVEND